MRLADLVGASVCTSAGERLGLVHEVYAKEGSVEALGVGSANLLERLIGRRRGRRIAWDRVRSIDGGTIIVEP